MIEWCVVTFSTLWKHFWIFAVTSVTFCNTTHKKVIILKTRLKKAMMKMRHPQCLTNLMLLTWNRWTRSCHLAAPNFKCCVAACGIIELLGEILGNYCELEGGDKLPMVASKSVSCQWLKNVARDPNHNFSILSSHQQMLKNYHCPIKIKTHINTGDSPGNPPHSRPSRWHCRMLSLAAAALKRKTVKCNAYTQI